MIDFGSDRALYKQLADIVREHIVAGLYDGQRLPSANSLARQHRVGDKVAEDALAVLRAEGWIETQRGQRATVRDEPERQTIYLSPPARWWSRRATTADAQRWNLALGERITVVIAGGEEQVYPSDRYEFVVQMPDDAEWSDEEPVSDSSLPPAE